MPEPAAHSYAWIKDTPLGAAATVTVVPATTPKKFKEALANPKHVPLDETVGNWDTDPRIVITKVGDGVLGLEFNGWQGSMGLLGRLSEGGKAGSVYWNESRSELVSLAENGKILEATELMIDEAPPVLAKLIPEFNRDDPKADGTMCFVALERFTGIELTPDDIERACTEGEAYAIDEETS